MNGGGRCPDCQVEPGSEHQDGCGVALCVRCGRQRMMCDRHSDWPMQTWTGVWPGITECWEWGWFATVSDGNGGRKRVEDLNRLWSDPATRWSPDLERWVLRTT